MTRRVAHHVFATELPPAVDRLDSIGHFSVVSGLDDILRFASRAAVVIALVALAFPGAWASPRETTPEEPGCERACPCDSDETNEAVDDTASANGTSPAGQSSVPGDPCGGEDGECPAGCDHCACCPGVAVATLPPRAAPFDPPPMDTVASLSSGNLLAGIPPRIFRPPQHSLL